ncbi:MAG: NADH-quinone oxidoreductase subunit C [candidate division Zixibacteria bacterium]|nr:NADH-quinone oxidoreductase subunit C [candidate division Zixibacteria bacterium]MDH3939170.1 NADH-quinone oxidoreductase subunit C [candidate division Zixibacteria bacterium]MDH4035044.1 NADH-quinone oxidoreductase subunit C [candidate division Zixibacteria bacterium]
MAAMEEQLRGFIKERFGDAIISEDDFRGDQSFFIKPQALIDICQALLDDTELNFKFLADLTAVDWLGHRREKDGRFEVVYNLYSIAHSYRFFLKVRLPAEDPSIATLCDLWPSANWMEREVYDLFGIVFVGHPELTKILTPDELDGHPLRKDFPLTYEQPQFSFNKNDPPEVTH